MNFFCMIFLELATNFASFFEQVSTFSSECLPNVTIGASFLHRTIEECGLDYINASLHVFSVPGLSSKHKNAEKAVTNCVEEKIVNHNFAVWHNVVSSSLAELPSNCFPQATSEEVLERFKLLKASGLKVIFYQRRSSLIDFEGEEKILCSCLVPYIKVGKLRRQFLKNHYRDKMQLADPQVEPPKKLIQNVVNIHSDDLIKMT